MNLPAERAGNRISVMGWKLSQLYGAVLLVRAGNRFGLLEEPGVRGSPANLRSDRAPGWAKWTGQRTVHGLERASLLRFEVRGGDVVCSARNTQHASVGVRTA